MMIYKRYSNIYGLTQKNCARMFVNRILSSVKRLEWMPAEMEKRLGDALLF